MESKLCRLCGKNGATSHIFERKPDDIELSAKIMYCCTNISIKVDDGLPSLVCSGCEQELDQCYQFVLKCEASDTQFRSIHAQPDNSTDSAPPIKVKSESNCGGKSDPYCDNIKAEIRLSEDDCDYDDIPLVNLCQNTTTKLKYTNDNTGKRTYKQRIKFKKQSKSAVCSVCSRQCTNQSTLVIHMRSHSNIYLFPCSLCDKKYKDSGNLKRHISRHHSEHTRSRNFICESCGKGFFTKHDLQIHMRTHTGETPYACTECPARFTQLGALFRHKKRHTGVKDHMCSICPKRFSTKQELKNHLTVHSTEKKYSCSVCNTCFKQKTNLTKHIKLHSDNLKFICNYCGRNFKFKGSLKLHIEKQHSEKSGYCESCSKHVSNLEAHMWKHTGERPLKCKLCTSSFYELKALIYHVNFKHAKTDRYKCDFEGCVMTFPSRPMLDFHVAKLHSTDIPFQCDRCSRAFYRKNDLARHKKGTHKERLV